MAFCGNCGSEVQDGVKFCPSCGKQTAGGAAFETGAGAGDARDAEENKLMAVIAYILFFVPLLAGAHKKSPFAKYHTNQGTILFLAALCLNILLRITRTILAAILYNAYTWGLWSMIASLLSLVGLLPLIFCIIGILNVVNGRTKPLPLIGGFTIIK